MIKKIAAIAAFVALSPALSFAATTTVDFNDGTDGAVVGSFYAAQGVTFSNASWTTTFGLPGSSTPLGIRSTDGGFQWFSGNPLIATFSGNVTSVSIVGIDVGANGLQINAYDAISGGSLVGTSQVFGSDVGVGEFYTVGATASLIKRVEIFQVQNVTGDGILLDNLEFTTSAVPEPASLALVGAGLATLAFVRRRRQG